MTDVTKKTVSFPTEDNWELKGDIISSQNPTQKILVSAGTGFPRQFYAGIAEFLAEKGAMVLIFDYRGIGESAPENIAKSNIQLIDWAKDQSAALAFLNAEATNLPLNHIAHSVGGHFLGFVDKQHLINKNAFVSVGTGYFGGHHKSNLPASMYFWWLLGSFSLARWGYIKPVGGWKGAALPPDVFKTWRRWSHKKHYFRNELNKRLPAGHFEEVQSPIRSWIFTDDPIATPRSSKDVLVTYPNAPKETIFKKPSDFGVKRIGHEGAFRKGREKLWQEIWDWLER